MRVAVSFVLLLSLLLISNLCGTSNSDSSASAATFERIDPTPSPSASSDNRSLSLKPYLSCKFEDDLQIVETTRRPKSAEKFRLVETASGNRTVSVLDGYRVMFAYPSTPYYFANIKVEQSNPQDYASDKEMVRSELQYSASTKHSTKIIHQDKTLYNGYESYGIDRDVIDVGGVIGTHVLFSAADHVIITVYFLNQGSENRKFQNIEEYRASKEKFLDRYTRCLKNNTAGTTQDEANSKLHGWHGLFIDQSTPEDAIRLLGKPISDKIDRLHIHVVDKWVSAKHKEKIFKILTFRKIEEVDQVDLAFIDSTLVMISFNLGTLGKNWPVGSLADMFGVGFTAVKRIPKDGQPSDYESTVSSNNLRFSENVYHMVAVSTRSYFYAYVADQNFFRNLVRSGGRAGPEDIITRLPGKVITMEIISRTLGRTEQNEGVR